MEWHVHLAQLIIYIVNNQGEDQIATKKDFQTEDHFFQ